MTEAKSGSFSTKTLGALHLSPATAELVNREAVTSGLPTLDDLMAWKAIRALKKQGKPPAPNTVKRERYQMTALMGKLGMDTLPELVEYLTHRGNVEAVLEHELVNTSPGTTRLLVYVLRSLSEWATEAGIGTLALKRDDLPPENPTKGHDVYTPDELELIRAEADSGRVSQRNRLLFHLLLSTGARIGELLQLSYQDLYLESGYASLTNPKGGRPNVLVLPDNCIALLRGMDLAAMHHAEKGFARSPKEYLFPQSYPAARALWLTHQERAGVRPRGLHCARHSFATRLLAQGESLVAVQHLLHHSSIITTSRVYDQSTALSYRHALNQNGRTDNG